MLVRRCRRLHQTRPGGSFKGLELSNQLREFLFCQTPQGLEHGLEQVSHALSFETPSTPRDRGALCGCGSFAARACFVRRRTSSFTPMTPCCAYRRKSSSGIRLGKRVGWSDRHGFRGNEVGSLQTTSVHHPRPNCASRHVEPLCSQQFRLTPR